MDIREEQDEAEVEIMEGSSSDTTEEPDLDSISEPVPVKKSVWNRGEADVVVMPKKERPKAQMTDTTSLSTAVDEQEPPSD